MSIPDYITTFSEAQAFTTTEVSDNVNSHPSDAERNQFYAGDTTLKIWVTTLFAGIASGLRVEFRFDTAASLASGSQVIVAATRVIKAAELVAGAIFFLEIPASRVPSGYDFSGAFYVPVSEAASAGALSAALVSGPERAQVMV